MKKIALISTFCDTQEKIDVLVENSRILKSLGVDVMVNSPISLPFEVIQEFDFYFKNKENPVLSWPERVHTAWRIQTNKLGQEIKIIRGMKEYGWAAMYQIKKLSEIALSYDYDIFYHMNYDILIDEGLILEITNNNKNKIYPVRDQRTPHVWQGSPLLSSFDREGLQKISNDITKQNYQNRSSIAEDFVFSWVEIFGMEQSDYYAKDRISLGSESEIFSDLGKREDILDYSEDPGYKFFWSKEHDGQNFRFVVSEFDENEKIRVCVNEKIYKNLENLVPVETDIPCGIVDELLVIFRGRVYDYTEEYNKSVVNWIINL